MQLNPLTIKDKKMFNKFLSLKRHGLSAYAFENVYIWKALFDIKWIALKDSLCVFFKDGTGGFLYLPPLAERGNSGIIKNAFDIMDSFNKNLDMSRVENVEAQDLSFYQDLGYTCQDKFNDYLCRRQDLSQLKGNKFKSKRACFNYFIKHYTFQYSALSLRNRRDCLRLYDDWMQERKSRNQNRIYQGMLEDSQRCLRIAFQYYADLEFTGRVVKINKAIKAFTFGFQLNPDTFCILYEITDLSIKGLGQFVFRKFCSELDDYKYINIMDDSGLGNLKGTKLSYHPIKQIPAYIVKR